MVLIKLKSNDDKVFEVEKEVGHACSDIYHLPWTNYQIVKWNLLKPPTNILDNLKVAVMSVTIKQLLESLDDGDVSIF